VDKQRADLLSLQVEIHNSLSILCIDSTTPNSDSFAYDLSREAKRANSFVKTQKQFNENLHELLNEKGHPSDIFPKTVNDLLELESQSTLSILALRLPAHSDCRRQGPRACEVLRDEKTRFQVEDPQSQLVFEGSWGDVSVRVLQALPARSPIMIQSIPLYLVRSDLLG